MATTCCWLWAASSARASLTQTRSSRCSSRPNGSPLKPSNCLLTRTDSGQTRSRRRQWWRSPQTAVRNQWSHWLHAPATAERRSRIRRSSPGPSSSPSSQSRRSGPAARRRPCPSRCSSGRWRRSRAPRSPHQLQGRLSHPDERERSRGGHCQMGSDLPVQSCMGRRWVHSGRRAGASRFWRNLRARSAQIRDGRLPLPVIPVQSASCAASGRRGHWLGSSGTGAGCGRRLRAGSRTRSARRPAAERRSGHQAGVVS